MNRLEMFWAKVSQLWRYVGIIALAFGVSIAVVLWAANAHRAADGGRGGAFAAIIALCALFLRRDYGRDAFEEREGIADLKSPQADRLLTEVNSLADSLEEGSLRGEDIGTAIPLLRHLAERGDALEAWLMINSTGQTALNRTLVCASLIGTMFWGFGDLLSDWICKFHIWPCS